MRLRGKRCLGKLSAFWLQELFALGEVMETDKHDVQRKLVNIRNQISVISLNLGALKVSLDQLVMEQNDLVSLLEAAFEKQQTKPTTEKGDQKSE
jgi:regulator of replication initiation timing